MPDTTGPFYAAYIITAVVFVGYGFSIWRREKKAREALAALDDRASRRSS